MITCQECHGFQYELGEYPSDNLDECTCYMGVSELMDLQNRSIESQYKDAIERAEKAEARVKELEDIVHGIGKLLEENGHTVTFTLKANRLITKCHELFRTENK